MTMQYFRVTRTRVITEIAEMSVLETDETSAARAARRYASENNWSHVSTVTEDEFVAEKE